MTISEYIDKINSRFKTGISTEHSYRGDLQNLLESIAPDVMVTNEPTRVACGAPDYIITKRNIPIGYIEAKDIGADLGSKNYKEQFDRYKKSLNNLIITDYLNFQLFHDGVIITTITIGQIQGNKIVAKEIEFNSFINLINEFCTHLSQSIKSASKLATMMAGKARLLENVIESALLSDNEKKEDSSLKEQLNAFKEILIHDITPKAFADIYAQTIAYGMFAARLNDPSIEDFSRQEAAELIPKSNPFLRKFFQYIAGYDLDDRIKWIVDALAEIFRSTNISEILRDFGKATQQRDPMIHFYETFLSEYDPKLRKKRGVYYTPEPVVNFIVRAIDDILKSEFDILKGLADTSKIKIKVKDLTKATEDIGSKIINIEREEEFHKIQILDPAAGTGTFMAEIVKHIYKEFNEQHGIWASYVEDHLIPRLNGFEILMASYAIAHLKLDLLLLETGYKQRKDQRFKIYLTNSLEKYHPDTGTIFAGWLSNEANEANYIKRDTPIMVILGNPPYSIASSNLSDEHRALVDRYRYINGEKIKEKGALQFEKILNDDYIKFLALGEKFITKNSEGILAFINNHNFLDSPQLRGLRWQLVQSFDKIYVIDLHGNSKKREKCPDGSPDLNVFDIQQGVSINILIKKGNNKGKKLARVFHTECYGSREIKYDFLWNNSLSNLKFKEVQLQTDNYYFVPKDFKLKEEFNSFFNLPDLFIKNSTGIISARDNMVIDYSSENLIKRVLAFGNSELGNKELCDLMSISLKKGWDIDKARKKVSVISDVSKFIKTLNYRPFDTRQIFYDESLVWTTARPIMHNFFHGNNYGLIIGKKGQVVGSMQWNLSFITKEITDFNMFYRGGINIFPLYLISESSEQQTFDDKPERIPNLKKDILDRIAEKLALTFCKEKSESADSFSPIDILDYVYSILHSPNYREKFKEFIKTDFPRIPYPNNHQSFWKLVKFGAELRQLHLKESMVLEKYITSYSHEGSNKVEKLNYENGKVWINSDQYFDKIPLIAWEFYIGGYQPAQKWLKDRKGRILSFEDIMHYQKIIVALNETSRIMIEIDKIPFMD